MASAYRHRPGAHCGSTALRNLSAHHGWALDEAACFGLGAGIGFSYVDGGPADRLLMGRSAHLEPAFFDHLGIPVTRAMGQDRQAAWDALASRVADGPVIVFVDLGYLPYFDTDTHFGPHTILAVDVAEDAVTVSDSEFDDLQTVDRDAFDRAWSSEKGFGPLERRWLAVDDPTPTVPVESATREAIDLAARTMLGGGEGWGSQGVAGIRALADALPDWNDLPDPQWTARFAYQNIERRGTGGGAFRLLFADFLDTLGVAAGFEARLAEHAVAIADDWTTVGMTLRLASEGNDPAERAKRFETASQQVAAIADEEERLFEALDAAV